MTNKLFLPVTKKEVAAKGWTKLDIILFTGDAYVDHPSFGIAVIGRTLTEAGYKVAIVPQPNWQDDLRDFKKLGKPKLFFGVTAGAMDSMVNHYTAFKRLRHDDAYTPGGRHGARPDYASIVYSKILKNLYPETPVILGGIEASMRRLTHFDYWSNRLKPSILHESKANMIIYGMGEKTVLEIAERLKKGQKINEITDIKQTVFITNDKKKYLNNDNVIKLHSHTECIKSKIKFAENFRIFETESNRVEQKPVVQEIEDKLIVINPANLSLTENEIDKIYALPFTRLPHPKYKNKPSIPAYEMIKHSITIHRGCFGGCSFCTISAHQGKFIASRSEKSILKEVEQIANTPGFSGYISDIGGPSANMYKMQGKNLEICNACSRYSCIHPSVCNNLDTSHKKLLNLYKKIDNNTKIKKAFISSGIRYDLILHAKNPDKIKNINKLYLKQVITKHTSGRLKVAPEHTVDRVLKAMRKPGFNLFRILKSEFDKITKQEKIPYQLIPYFISSHPACTIDDMKKLMQETGQLNLITEQVQDFTPTPMTLATVMFYSGYDPYTLKKIYVTNNIREKKYQNSFFFKNDIKKSGPRVSNKNS